MTSSSIVIFDTRKFYLETMRVFDLRKNGPFPMKKTRFIFIVVDDWKVLIAMNDSVSKRDKHQQLRRRLHRQSSYFF